MREKSPNKFVYFMAAFSFFLAGCMLTLNSCAGNKTAKAEEETTEAADEAFYENQPLESGLYDADYYDIVGKNARKGKFDGRIYFGLQPSPNPSAINVFENGNRTKIDYILVLEKPFEKNDSGIFVTTDKKNNPVCVVPDSIYELKFINGSDTVQINFNPKPRHTATGVEVIEKINERRQK